MAPGTERWTTRIGVILAVAGSAVGLGNFLRFPGQAAANGGGVFMIPYFISLLLVGIPICWAEWVMGKYGGQHGFRSCPAILGVLGRHPFWRYAGVLGLLIPVVIYMYYVLIESWCLGYAISYLTGSVDLGSDPSAYTKRSGEFFASITGADTDGLMFEGKIHSSVWVWIAVFAVNFFLIYHGISKGIERFCTIAMPLMALCALIVLVRVLTLGTPNPEFPERNVINGLGAMWNPGGTGGKADWGALLNPKVWLAAAGQVFFSLSVGFGIIINYASYLRRKDDVVLSGLTGAATNEFFEVCLGGLITIPAAFIFLGAAGVVVGTFGLGFNTLPVVFQYMPAGWFFGFVWFLMLFLAAITSSLSMLQPAIAFLEEALGIGRKASVAILGVITALGSFFVLYFSKGLAALDAMDFWVGTLLIFVLATIEVVLFAWVFGAARGWAFANEGAQLRLPRPFVFVIQYLTPTFLLLIFGFFTWYNAPEYISALRQNPIAQMAIGVIVTVGIFFGLIVAIAGPRWRAEAADRDRAFPVHTED